MAALATELGDEPIRELAAEILAREEYAAWRPDLEAWSQLLDWLAGLTRWLEGLRVEAPGLYWLVVFGLLVVALGLLAHVVWTVSVALRATPPLAGRARATPAPDLWQRAEALAAEGRYLDGARELERASLALLLEGRVIELARSEPNRVLRRRLRRAALPEAERRELLALIDRLERRVFREAAEDPELYAAWRALYRRLGASAASGRPDLPAEARPDPQAAA